VLEEILQVSPSHASNPNAGMAKFSIRGSGQGLRVVEEQWSPQSRSGRHLQEFASIVSTAKGFGEAYLESGGGTAWIHVQALTVNL
jgi:hypothetical protein